MAKINNYFCLDARKIDTILVPDSVQTIITSPPYFDVKNYGNGACQIGWNQNYEDYISDIKTIFQHCYDATVDSGTLWLVVDTYKRGGRLKLLPLEVMRILEKIGWMPQDVVIWDKIKNLPYSRKGQFRKNFEYILHLSKTKDFKYYIDRIREIDTLQQWWIRYPERYNPKGKVPENIWRISIPNQGSWGNDSIEHLCPFPPKLIERLILLSTDEDDLVLDPFAGSGIVLAQAKCMGRNYIGCDINGEYISKFDSKVLPEIEKLWQIREKELDEIKTQQQELENFILSLRKLKFGKKILELAIKKFGRENFKLLIIETKNQKDSNSVFVTLVLANKNYSFIENVKNWLIEQTLKRPLSRFSLSSSLKLISDEELSYDFKEKGNFIYLEGKFYEKEDDINIKDIVNEDKYDFPAIISNIEISREIIRKSSLPYPEIK